MVGKKKRRGRKRPGKTEVPVMVLRSALKQSGEKSAQRDPGEKGQTCCYYGKGGHLKQNYCQASKPPPAPCLV